MFYHVLLQNFVEMAPIVCMPPAVADSIHLMCSLRRLMTHHVSSLLTDRAGGTAHMLVPRLQTQQLVHSAFK